MHGRYSGWSPPPYIIIVSTSRPPDVTHVVDETRPSPFLRSSASVYFTERKPKNENGGGLGTRLKLTNLRERGRSDFVTGPSAKCQCISLKSRKKINKAPLAESRPVTVLQFLLTSNLVKKHQKVIIVTIADALAEQQVIVVAITYPIAHSKGHIQNSISKDAEG